MKFASLVLVGCLALFQATQVHGDRKFGPPTGGNNSTHKIKTAAAFANGGAKMDMCPAGDCDNGQRVRIAMSRLEELAPDNTSVPKHKAENFASLDATWSDLTQIVMDGVNVSSTSFVSDIAVGPKNSPAGTAKFNLTASIYSGNATVMNGNQAITIPAGAMKFTLSISQWPFADPNNSLHFGVSVLTRRANGTDCGKPEKKLKPKANSTAPQEKIDRVELGDGMYMDAPAEAVLDGVNKAITAEIVASGGSVEYVWTFPSFTTSLYYDPVVGSEEATTTATTATTSPTTTATGTNSTTNSSAAFPLWKAASSAVAGAVAVAAVLLV